MKSIKGNKKKDFKKFVGSLSAHENFLIESLRREWDEAEKAAKRADLVQHLKQGSLVAAKGLLVLLAIAGVITVAAVAPNVFAAFGKIFRQRRFYDKRDFHRTARYLRNKKYIKMENYSGGYKISLTDRGKELLLQKTLQDLKIQRKPKWERQWHLVIFDIPNSKKPARDALRERLQAIGLYRLQKSVFAFPDPCEKEINFLADLYNVHEYIKIIKAVEISNDHSIRMYFGIS